MVPIVYNLRSLAARRVTALLTALGIALVVFVLAASMMLAEGIKRVFKTTGRPDTAIVLRKGSDAELASNIEQRHVGMVMAAPGVEKTGAEGVGVAEIVTVIIVNKMGTNYVSNVRVRGVPANVMQFRPEVRIVEGRPARPGTDEVVIGQQLKGRFEGIRLGGSFELKKNRPVRVVGVFESAGSSYESEVWADVETARSSFGRSGLVTSIRVRLTAPSAFDGFKAAIESDKQLQLEAFREPAYYEKQSEGTALFVSALGSTIAFFFALGAMIGAAITMHGAVAQRRREIGTLRALGFSRRSVLSSFLLEAVLLALGGGLIGAGAAMAMGFVRFSMMNLSGWNEIIFSFTPTAPILAKSICFGCVMGLMGGLFPAIRAARLQPAHAIRD